MRLLIIFILVIFSIAEFAKEKNSNDDLNSLIETEYAFAKKSETVGIRAAFLTYLTDEAIILKHEPVNGKAAHANSPNVPGMLTWRPVFAEVSCAGDLGYTTGPWEFRKGGLDDEPTGFGHYVSLWQKQADGQWRVVLDTGINYPVKDTTIIELTIPKENVAMTVFSPIIDVETESNSILVAEQQLAQAALSDGFVKALVGNSVEDVRIYRMNFFPVIGRDKIHKIIDTITDELSWEPMAAHVSRSGDMGYAFGVCELRTDSKTRPTKYGSYLRIWKRRVPGNWQVVLDLINPIPQPGKSSDN